MALRKRIDRPADPPPSQAPPPQAAAPEAAVVEAPAEVAPPVHEPISEVMSMPEFAGDDEVTVIGPGATLEGLLVSGGSLRIEGEVRGEVRAEGGVLVAPQAKVEAEVRAQSLRVEGRYTGNAEISSRIELGPTAQVEGNLTCGGLVVQEGALFNGQTSMSKGAPVISLSEVEKAEQA